MVSAEMERILTKLVQNAPVASGPSSLDVHCFYCNEYTSWRTPNAITHLPTCLISQARNILAVIQSTT